MDEGSWREQGGPVLSIEGSAAALLTGERTALNFLGRLSGIATLAARFVREVEGTGTVVLDTRKTTPGLRTLEKAAVAAGGASNHRVGLFDAILIKENHIAAAGGIAQAVACVREAAPELAGTLEVEVRNPQEIDEALAAGAPRLLLDNMSVDELRAAVAQVGGRATLEASGNVTLENIRERALTGVDFISVGALTHSAPALDLSLILEVDEMKTLPMIPTQGPLPALTEAEIDELHEEVRALAAERNATILAHNYQVPEVQQVADYVGDSLGLSRQAAASDAETIVFCGVHFMAETASILCPEKTVLIPDLDAGCSLAASIDAEQLGEWRASYPEGWWSCM